ncbi:MAG: low-specificity L-threonine aldolase [Bacillales bacterium]|jgi:threonine aldolase|nr:low-specificity L-threonine aldolase [Bacillales bacterium]
MKKWIDLRSDTVTNPTDKMREAMFHAVVGDDVYEDDPTVKELEDYAADLVGKEAALFVPTGTFGNQLAVFTHCKRGDEVILGEDCHIIAHEVGAAAVISGVQLRTLETKRGMMNLDKIEATIRPFEDLHWPETGLICLENAYSDGAVPSLEYMKSVKSIAKKYNLPIHLDGARLFNAATNLGVPASEIVKHVDTVQFCLSKGLCAPVGSIVAGSKEFIIRARKNRKLLGGGMRQVGFLAAAGLIALKEMTLRLHEDHENARYFAEKLKEIPCIYLSETPIDINMVFFKINQNKLTDEEILDLLLEKGIKSNGPEAGYWRFVTHYWISKEDIHYVIEVLKKILE